MYTSSWRSIAQHRVPQWLKDCKFGIYTHWGVYSVPACGPNATWYAYNMYREGSLQNLYHRLHFGEVSRFGYKDFIPMFTAEKFDPDEWAELFKKAKIGVNRIDEMAAKAVENGSLGNFASLGKEDIAKILRIAE